MELVASSPQDATSTAMKNRDADVAEQEKFKAKVTNLKAAQATTTIEENMVDGILSSFRQFSSRLFGADAGHTSVDVPATVTEEEDHEAGDEMTALAAEYRASVREPHPPDEAEEDKASLPKKEGKAYLPPPATKQQRKRVPLTPRVIGAAGAVVRAPAKGFRKVSKVLADGLDQVLEEVDTLIGDEKPSKAKAKPTALTTAVGRSMK